jgi:hypothetical protein
MLNATLSSSWLIGAWLAIVATSAVASVVMGASLSTTALLLALGIAPAVIMAVLSYSQPPQSVAQILYAVEKKDRRP